MSIIDYDDKFDRILESMSLNKYELVDLPKVATWWLFEQVYRSWNCQGWREFNGTEFRSWPSPEIFFVSPCENELENASMQLGSRRDIVTWYHSLRIHLPAIVLIVSYYKTHSLQLKELAFKTCPKVYGVCEYCSCQTTVLLLEIFLYLLEAARKLQPQNGILVHNTFSFVHCWLLIASSVHCANS